MSNQNLSRALLTSPPAPPRSPGVPLRAVLVPGPAPHPLACEIAATTTPTASTSSTGTASTAWDNKASYFFFENTNPMASSEV